MCLILPLPIATMTFWCTSSHSTVQFLMQLLSCCYAMTSHKKHSIIAECQIADLTREYTCSVGQPEIILPSAVDPRGIMFIDTPRLIINCDLESTVIPAPFFNWMKDGVTVARNLQRGKFIFQPLSTEFYMQGSNSKLLKLMSPISVDSQLRLIVDFSLDPRIWNVTALLAMFDEATSVNDLRQIIYNLAAGNWTCTASNTFGRSSKFSFISSK